MAGDFSPLTIEPRPGEARVAPPALLVAMAVGLGSMDMPVPSVAEWHWLNWKFPRPVRAGETIYALWTLTQKRPPVAGTLTSIVVWRVDVHTSDGALCAEGEVGASVKRQAGAKARERDPEATASAPAATTTRRRRRRRATGGNGQKAVSDGAGPVAETAAIAPPTASAAKPDRSPATRGRRRRRRSPTGATADKGSASVPEPPIAEPAKPRELPAPAVAASAATPASPLSRVIRRLRRT